MDGPSWRASVEGLSYTVWKNLVGGGHEQEFRAFSVALSASGGASNGELKQEFS